MESFRAGGVSRWKVIKAESNPQKNDELFMLLSEPFNQTLFG